MATFTTAGDSVNLTSVASGETLAVSLSGTYSMVIVCQREIGSFGSGTWETLKSYSTVDATVADTVYTTQDRQRFRLFVVSAASGECTATLSDVTDSVDQIFFDADGHPILTLTEAGTYVAGTFGVAGATVLESTLGVTGATTLSGTLAAGASTLASAAITAGATVGTTLGVTGATVLSSTLAAGASTLASAVITAGATVGTTLGVTGATVLSSTLAAGASTLASATVTGAATVGTTLGVTGLLTATVGVTTPPVVVTEAAAPLTRAAHAFRAIILNNATGFKVQLPNATGSGDWYEFFVGTTVTSGVHEINAFEVGNDVINGVIVGVDADDSAEFTWGAKGTENMIQLGNTNNAQGGFRGDRIKVTDIAAGVWSVSGTIIQDGSEATPFGTDS